MRISKSALQPKIRIVTKSGEKWRVIDYTEYHILEVDEFGDVLDDTVIDQSSPDGELERQWSAAVACLPPYAMRKGICVKIELERRVYTTIGRAENDPDIYEDELDEVVETTIATA